MGEWPSWPTERLADAMDALSRAAGLAPRVSPWLSLPTASLEQTAQLAASALGIEAEPVTCVASETEALVHHGGPLLLRVERAEGPVLLALLSTKRRRARLIGPDQASHDVDAAALAALIRGRRETELSAGLDRMLERAQVAADERGAVRTELARERLQRVSLQPGWLLRPREAAPLHSHGREHHVTTLALALLFANLAFYLGWLLSWQMVGSAALHGRLETSWLWAWTLLLIALVPARMLATSLHGSLGVLVGALLRQRLLVGALKHVPSERRSEGVGALLGRVLEADTLEGRLMSGGSLALFGAMELCFSFLILARGIGGGLHVAMLAVWCAFFAFACRRYLSGRRVLTQSRLDVSEATIEQMVGQRTVRVQQSPTEWYESQDRSLEGHLTLWKRLDTQEALLLALPARGWMVLALIALVPAIMGGEPDIVALSVSLGGILLGFRALQGLGASVPHLVAAQISWEKTHALREAAAREGNPGQPWLAPMSPAAHGPVLWAENIHFGYASRGRSALAGVNLRVEPKDRLLLQGPSGSGKSTLASILAGLRQPSTGVLFLAGADRHTWGDADWRHRSALVPQFHENHVLSHSLAFNLLMGRGWPPSEQDLRDAEQLCRRLGLGPLIDRMPSGLHQIVGESGWRLSHGERSRIFLARALLQRPQLLTLDETFGALDPANLKLALETVLEDAPALLVIAHP